MLDEKLVNGIILLAIPALILLSILTIYQSSVMSIQCPAYGSNITTIITSFDTESEEALLVKIVYPCNLIPPSPAMLVSSGGVKGKVTVQDLAKIYLPNGKVIYLGRIEWYKEKGCVYVYIGNNLAGKVGIDKIINKTYIFTGKVEGCEVKVYVTYVKIPMISFHPSLNPMERIPKEIRDQIERRALNILENSFFLRWLNESGFKYKIISISSHPILCMNYTARLVFRSAWIETKVYDSLGNETNVFYSIDLRKNYTITYSKYIIPKEFTTPPPREERWENNIILYILYDGGGKCYTYQCLKRISEPSSSVRHRAPKYTPQRNISDELKAKIMELLEKNRLTNMLFKNGCKIKDISVTQSYSRIYVYVRAEFKGISLSIRFRGTSPQNLYLDRIVVFL